MNNVEIPQDLLEKYRKLIKRRMRSDDVNQYIAILIESELRKSGEEGYAHDSLTGCKNRSQVIRDFQEVLGHNGWDDISVFHNQYLCVDIDQFKNYTEFYGIMAGDNLLKDLASQLQQNYPGKNIYRYGGDEFVVEMKDSVFQPIQMSNVEIRYSLIDVQIMRDGQSRHNFERFLDMYIEMGILESSIQGTMIKFRYPPEKAG